MLELLDRDFAVGVSADIGGDAHGFAHNRLGIERPGQVNQHRSNDEHHQRRAERAHSPGSGRLKMSEGQVRLPSKTLRDSGYPGTAAGTKTRIPILGLLSVPTSSGHPMEINRASR